MGIFKRKVVYSGSMSVDPALVRQWEDYAAMSGQALHIPGGVEPNSYLKDQVREGNKQAAEFRQQVSREYDRLKKEKGRKATQKEAEANVRKTFKWKKKR